MRRCVRSALTFGERTALALSSRLLFQGTEVCHTDREQVLSRVAVVLLFSTYQPLL